MLGIHRATRGRTRPSLAPCAKVHVPGLEADLRGLLPVAVVREADLQELPDDLQLVPEVRVVLPQGLEGVRGAQEVGRDLRVDRAGPGRLAVGRPRPRG